MKKEYKGYRAYHRLLKELKSTTDLRKMKFKIEQYVNSGNYYPSYRSSGSNMTLGDCNGDGAVDILDVVSLIGYILQTVDDPDAIALIEANCDVFFQNGELVEDGSGSGIVITDVVAVINYILYQEDPIVYGCMDSTANNYNPEATEDDGSCTYDLVIPDPVITDEELEGIVDTNEYGDGGYYSTRYTDLETDPNDGWEFYEPSILEPEYGPNVVLITAPHGQGHYRSSRWKGTGNHDNPGAGLYHCAGSNLPYCYKTPDSCTSSMARALSDFTGSPSIVSRYQQEDPNYYHIIGADRWCCDDECTTDFGGLPPTPTHDCGDSIYNTWSGNEADPENQDLYQYAGIQTKAFYDAYWNDDTTFPDYQTWEKINQIHPFKVAISNYLDSNPNIKLVIDLHGASYTSNKWDVDFGLLCSGQGPWQDLSSVQICAASAGVPPAIDFDMLEIIAITMDEYGIGKCTSVCEGSDSCCIEGSCDYLKYGDCPDGETGHGHMSFNDFTGGGQDSVAHYVSLYHGNDGVQTIQIEASYIYRCLNSDDEYWVRFMRALQTIIVRANQYYNTGSFRDYNYKNMVGESEIDSTGFNTRGGNKSLAIRGRKNSKKYTMNRLKNLE